MHQFAHGFTFDLTDPLAGHVELLADLIKCVFRGCVEPESHPEDLGFARRQRVERLIDCGAQVRVDRRLAGELAETSSIMSPSVASASSPTGVSSETGCLPSLRMLR